MNDEGDIDSRKGAWTTQVGAATAGVTMEADT